MSTLRTPAYILQLVDKLVNEASAIPFPEGGRGRGIAVRKIRSRLTNAQKLLALRRRQAYKGRFDETRVNELEDKIKALWPRNLSHS
jgi:hypothetical protein